MSDKITSWSFSRWSAYEKCPKMAYFKFIKKLKEPSSPALEKGTAWHLLCEKYLKAGGRIPKELEKVKDILKDLRKNEALAEADFAFRKDWSPTKSTDWTGAWVRIKADALTLPKADDAVPTVYIDDFKTGKQKEGMEEYGPQLELYALAGLLSCPTAECARTSLIFLDHGTRVDNPEIFVQKDVPKLKKRWEIRVKKMLNDTTFKEKPGNACRWCHFRKDNAENGGGQCKF